MGDNNKENLTTKTKAWFLEFYKYSSFWLKLFISLIAVILAIIGIYKIATSALFYFDEPLSSFDPERLGQLGDFLGGTLNPIFGFLTVCLLLWSIFIQRKELTLTRDELKKSAHALSYQLKISIHEYNRKQIEEILTKKESEYSQLIKTGFEYISISFPNNSGTPSIKSLTTIKDLIDSQKTKTPSNLRNIVEDIIEGSPTNDSEIERRKKILKFIQLTNEMQSLYIELLKITSVEAIRSYIKDCANEKITNALLTHTIPVGQINKMSNDIETSVFEL